MAPGFERRDVGRGQAAKRRAKSPREKFLPVSSGNAVENRGESRSALNAIDKKTRNLKNR
jgi:hypothetical protein